MITAPHRWGVALAAVLLFAVLGCAAPEPAPPGLDLGGTWTVTTVGGRVPVPMSEPRIQFTVGGGIEGSTGCNDFGGRVDITDGRIRVRELIQTEMGCLGPVGEVEAAFVRALADAERIAVTDGVLIISGPGGEIRAER